MAIKSNDKTKNIPDLDAKLRRCFTLRVAFNIVYAGLQLPSSKHARLLPFRYLSNKVMGKLHMNVVPRSTINTNVGTEN